MNIEYIICAIFFLFSLFMSVQDIKTQKVSRWTSVSLLVVIIAARIIFFKGDERVGFIVSAVIGLALFEAVRFIVKKKLGLADVFYSGSAGALLGFDMWLAMCFIACLVAALVIFIRIQKLPPEKRGVGIKESLRLPVPFIPCMFFGAIISKIFIFFLN